MRTCGPPSLPLVESSHRLDSINTRETLMAQAYGDLYSPKDSPAGPGLGAAVLEETDAAESLERPQNPTIDLASSREQISPDQPRHEDHNHKQHVHFDVQINKNEKGLTVEQFKNSYHNCCSYIKVM